MVNKDYHDFLLVVNCHISCISHRFWDTTSQSSKPPPPIVWALIKWTPFEFCRQTYHTERQDGALLFKIRMILTSVVLSQYTRVTDNSQTDRRRTTYHDNSRTIKLKRSAKSDKIGKDGKITDNITECNSLTCSPLLSPFCCKILMLINSLLSPREYFSTVTTAVLWVLSSAVYKNERVQRRWL